jgi:hypothetical protein
MTGTASNPVTIPEAQPQVEVNDLYVSSKKLDTFQYESSGKLDTFMSSKRAAHHNQGGNKQKHHHHQKHSNSESLGGRGSDESSSSDFDIVISDTHSVITELTNEGFDPATPGTNAINPRLTAALAAAAKQAAPGMKVTNTGEDNVANSYGNYISMKSASSMHKPQPQAKALPKRMPLYNGSDASSSGQRTKSPNSSNQPGMQGGQHVHPEVEAFLASAMKHARLSQSFVNHDGDDDDDDIPPTTDEESMADHQKQRRRHHRHQSSDSRKNSGRSSKRSQDTSSSGRRKKKSSLASSSKPSNSNSKSSSEGDSDKLRTSLGSQSDPNLLHGHGTSQDANPQGHHMKSKSQAAELLQSILAESYGPSTTTAKAAELRRGSRRESMQSFFSEDEENNTFSSSLGEDFAC